MPRSEATTKSRLLALLSPRAKAARLLGDPPLLSESTVRHPLGYHRQPEGWQSGDTPSGETSCPGNFSPLARACYPDSPRYRRSPLSRVGRGFVRAAEKRARALAVDLGSRTGAAARSAGSEGIEERPLFGHSIPRPSSERRRRREPRAAGRRASEPALRRSAGRTPPAQAIRQESALPEPHPVKYVLARIFELYKRFVSPFLPRSCRFTPTCSEYARLAVLEYGALRGGWMTLCRLGRCQPLHPGGVDIP